VKVVVVGAEEYAGRHAMAAIDGAVGVAADADIENAVDGASVVVCCAVTWDATHRLRMSREPHPLLPRLVGACRRARVRRVVHLSTALVVGPDHPGPMRITEATMPKPVHPFEKLKLREEEWLRAHQGDLEVVVVRAATGFGAHDRMLARMLGELERGSLRLVNGGRAKRTFLAGPDLGRALAAATVRGRAGATYLVGGFDGSWQELFAIAAHVLGVPPKGHGIPYDLAYMAAAVRELRTPVGTECWPNLLTVDLQSKEHLLDDGRSRRDLAWSPQIGSFEEGVMELATWYRSLEGVPSPIG
jgi:nucleoside-diphosphate-sugar epimerase